MLSFLYLDANVVNAIAGDIRKENETACCIRNDGSGCVQTSEDDCSVRNKFMSNINIKFNIKFYQKTQLGLIINYFYNITIPEDSIFVV